MVYKGGKCVCFVLKNNCFFEVNPPSSQSGSHNFDLILNFILHQNKNEPAFSGRSKIEKLGS